MKKPIQIFIFFLTVNFFLGIHIVKAQTSDTGNLPEGVKIITGTVEDDQGMPIPSVTIQIRSTNTKVQTNYDGLFSIKAKDGDVLIFIYEGMKTQNMKVSKKTKIKVVMTDLYDVDNAVISGCCFGGCSSKISVASEFMFNY